MTFIYPEEVPLEYFERVKSHKKTNLALVDVHFKPSIRFFPVINISDNIMRKQNEPASVLPLLLI